MISPSVPFVCNGREREEREGSNSRVSPRVYCSRLGNEISLEMQGHIKVVVTHFLYRPTNRLRRLQLVRPPQSSFDFSSEPLGRIFNLVFRQPPSRSRRDSEIKSVNEIYSDCFVLVVASGSHSLFLSLSRERRNRLFGLAVVFCSLSLFQCLLPTPASKPTLPPSFQMASPCFVL